MTQYNVTGMSCAACVARVEKAVSKIDGVNSCSVSLLDRKSTRLNSSHMPKSRMPSSA